MIEKVFKKASSNSAEKYKYFSAAASDIYYVRQSSLIKNYILFPDFKEIK